MAVFRLALFLLFIGGTGAQQIEPLNVPVLIGSTALFNCSTPNLQSGMTWLLNNVMVINIQTNQWSPSNPRFSATNYTMPGNYKWQFNISKVDRSDTGQVTCQVLGAGPLASSLSVQERGSVSITGGNQIVTEGVKTDFQCRADGWYPAPNVSWSVNGVVVNYCTNSSVAQGNVFNTNCTLSITATKNSSVVCLVKVPAMSSPDSSTVFLTIAPKARDQTILIAVTVAFSAAALLFLIIFGIFFFCKRRKKEKSGYQEELRRARVQSHHRAPVTTDARGRDNRGYVTDGRHGADFNGAVWHTNYPPKHQKSYPRDDFFDDGHRNHRHMTML